MADARLQLVTWRNGINVDSSVFGTDSGANTELRPSLSNWNVVRSRS